MGICESSESPYKVSTQDVAKHREAERDLREAKIKLSSLVKVLLLGSGDSGKSTVLKQMRLIHRKLFSPHEIEVYRRVIFANITNGLKFLLESMELFDLAVLEENEPLVNFILNCEEIQEGEPFPSSYYGPLKTLWADPNVQRAWERGNEVALPDNLEYFFSSLDRLFHPTYSPGDQDIVRCRIRTSGISETSFDLRNHELIMVDVGGQRSERRKWIHCFQDVTAILFLVSLGGYDQSLIEDKDANQMQDAMTIWDSICHSQWFKSTSMILFLNKNDIFESKIRHSHIKTYFPDYEGEECDVRAGRDYFKRRFLRLSYKAGWSKEREVYVHITTAIDTSMLRVVMGAVEDTILNANLRAASLLKL